MKDFMIGCNFWDSKSGTDMWLNFDEESLAKDLDALAATGIKYMRCFPNWREFQPVIALKGWGGFLNEYRMSGDRFPENEYYIDPVMIERFRKFALMADERGIKLVVSVLTGWMSGRLFYPQILESRNLITDPLALMFEEKFVRGFVTYTKDLPNIVMWDLGNECNCMGQVSKPEESYLWTCTIRNAILAADNSRKISSGMHSLRFNETEPWSIIEQGLLTDMLSNHPYPSPTVGGDVDQANRLRTTMIPTAQCEYYSALSGKPTMIQEQGTFNDMLINREGAADFARINIASSYANGFNGYFWWCSHEHLKLNQPPYTWSMIERQLGLLDADRNPKPVGKEIKRMGDLLETLPDISPKITDSVIVLSNEQDQQQIGITSYILAKRAGLTPTFAHYKHHIPEAPFYILPSITGWAPMTKECFDTLIDRVMNGATLLITVNTGMICDFEKLTGLRSAGMTSGGKGTFTLDGQVLPYEYGKKFHISSIGAKVLASAEDGNVILSENKLGKGKLMFLSYPLELNLWKLQGAYEKGEPYYHHIYEVAAKEILANKPMKCLNPDISLTLHKEDDGYYAVAVNYMNDVADSEVSLADGWTLETVYGDFTAVEGCGMAVGKIVKK